MTTSNVLTCFGAGGSSAHTTTVVSVGASFPLHTESGKRYLIDAAGHPFLIQGDAAWSLIGELKQAEVIRYLDDRKSRGFNTLLVNLLEHKFSTRAPKNAYGDGPFLMVGDFTTPNEGYFAHVDWVLQRAADRGFLVLLVPAYLGYDGGNEGWYQEMTANGADKLRQYGRYLGQRYQRYSNVLWTYGGDFNPPNRTLVEAMANGIREFDTRSLSTAHCGPETAAMQYWGDEAWLKINNVYTYRPVYIKALEEYRRPEQMPFLLLESTYENEHDSTAKLMRTQAYHALLSGAAGQIFGNNPLWHFSGPGVYSISMTWQQALSSPGSQSMTHLWKLFTSRNWWQLQPDASNVVLVGGLGSEQERAVAAVADDRQFAVAYLPTARTITMHLDGLAGPLISAEWYDPSSGTYQPASGSPFAASGTQTFKSPGRSSGGAEDWVLVLNSRQ